MANFFDLMRQYFLGPGNFGEQLIVFGLMYSRLLIIVTMVPFLGANGVLNSVKISISLCLAFLFWPYVFSHCAEIPTDFITLLLLLLKEVFIGFIIGFIVSQIFYAASMAGQLIDIFRGASMIQVMVPQLKQQSSAFANMLFQLSVVLFMTTGLHALFFNALADSFINIPVDQFPKIGIGWESFALWMIKYFAHLFTVAFKLSVPIAIVVLMINVAFGLMNRVAPQINAFFMSLPAMTVGGLMIFFAASSSTVERLLKIAATMMKKLTEGIQLFY